MGYGETFKIIEDMDLFLVIMPLLINTLNEMNCEPLVDEKEID